MQLNVHSSVMSSLDAIRTNYQAYICVHLKLTLSFPTLLSNTSKSWKSLEHVPFAVFSQNSGRTRPFTRFRNMQVQEQDTNIVLEIMPACSDMWFGPVTSAPAMQKAILFGLFLGALICPRMF